MGAPGQAAAEGSAEAASAWYGEDVSELLADCWRLDAAQRPPMSAVEARLAAVCAALSREEDEARRRREDLADDGNRTAAKVNCACAHESSASCLGCHALVASGRFAMAT